MGDTSETNTKFLSRKLFLGEKRLYRKFIICATWALFPGSHIRLLNCMKIVDVALLLWVVVGLHMAINDINAEPVFTEIFLDLQI